MSRFRTSRPSGMKPKLVPARSITSLRETAEVHPYLVLSPPDLLTMVNALFPERRLNSAASLRDIHSGELRSGASSVSGFSLTGPRSQDVETASVVSMDAESVVSDITTSREPLLPNHTGQSTLSQPTLTRNPLYEEDGYELRAAIYEIAQALGNNALRGACHPCDEGWTVLFVSPDGHALSTRMVHDIDEQDDDEITSSSDDEQARPASSDLNSDYDQLRDSVLKLVEEYEIPQTFDPLNESKTLSNRASTLAGAKKISRSRTTLSQQVASNNPYRKSEIALEKASEAPTEDATFVNPATENLVEVERQPALALMLEAAASQCTSRSDFVNAHLYWNTLNQLNQMTSVSLRKDSYATLLHIFSRGPRDSIRRSAAAIEEYEAWLVWLKQSQERHDTIIESMLKNLRALRDKMWYVTDVRNSAPYERARNIAVALKFMAAPPKKPSYHAGLRPRHISRSSNSNAYLLKTEAQVMEMLACPDEHGGPNKLTDEQSEKTLKWMSEYGIENFCKGEERIHRFCLEIESCINNLVGESLMDGPVLWSSELYHWDKRILHGDRQKGDSLASMFGMLGIGEEHGDDLRHRGLRSTDFARPNTRDLRSMTNRNVSQQSFDSGRYTMSRTSVETVDPQDIYGSSNPALPSETLNTCWSPPQARSHSPASSINSARPGTATSLAGDGILGRDEHANVAKQKFLSDLRQTLTSLLVSDLGTLVFSKGSETDSWFSGELGRDFLERREQGGRKIRRRSRKRVIEKKKSIRDLRGANRTDAAPESSVDAVKGVEVHSMAADGIMTDHIAGADSSSTNETVTSAHNVARAPIVQEVESPEFPYKKAFRRLLRMFAVHPNPYSKLNALYELEQLIIAYLTPPTNIRRARSRVEVLHASSNVSDIPPVHASGLFEGQSQHHRAKNLEETIDNCKERRSHTMPMSSMTSPQKGEHAKSASMSTGTDAIVDVLQWLFRTADIRPKTLFRDLQFIASFVPASILDQTPRGKAFWDAGLAALGLKQDVCRGLVEIADAIVAHYTFTRAVTMTSMLPDAHATAGATSDPDVTKYSMQDAARMLIITAKEGDPTAERELAIFYLTHPELVERVTAPLTGARRVFRDCKVEDMARAEKGEREKSDPRVMTVAKHWMELSALGGDELARKYMRQREEFGGGS